MNGKTLSKSTKKVPNQPRQYKSREDDSLKESHDEISTLKKQYQVFYDELPDLLRTIDTNGIILDCNKSYAETFGYSKEELIGKSVFDFLAGEGNQAYEESFKTWINTGNVKNKSVWFKRKDGTKFLGLLSASSLYDENGKVIGSNTIIKDITEIHEAREKIEDREKHLQQQMKDLQNSNNLLAIAEKKFRNLYDKTPSLLRTISVEGVLIDCNEAYARALGYSKEQALGMSIYDHTAARSLKEMKGNFDDWLKTHETKPCEIWMKRKEGSIFPALLTGTSLFNEDGKLMGRTLALTDMTEIYEARTKLEESQKQLQDQINQLEKSNVRFQVAERKYKDLYDKTPVLLRSITLEGILTDCNEAYARALGYTKEEVVGRSLFDHTADQSIEKMKQNIENWIGTHEIRYSEIWMKRKDGSIFPVLLSGASITDEYGNVIGRTVALTDMTEIYEARKKLQEDEARIRLQYDELHKSHELLTVTEQRYRGLYEKTPALLRTITLDGVLTDCNESYAKALGYTREDAIGVSLFNHTAERSIKDMQESLSSWHHSHQVAQKEIWMKRKDGSIFPVLLSGSSITDEQGNVIGRTVALTDMTEIYEARKRLEEKEARIRQQYEELKKLDIAKEEFSSMISHELKTPLTPIMGWVQALKNPKILGELTPKQAQALDAIQSNAVRLRDLVSDMLDAQKLDMKKMKFDQKYIDVTELMNFLTKNLQSAMEPKQIEFINLTEQNLVLKSDRARLEQVLNNIILNSVDFVPEKGRIEIRAENKDDKVQFMIKDNGIGIPKDKQQHLFKQFFQLDTSATRKHGGSGLGLSICKGIVEALGGEISVDSDAGKGATFYFTIPNEAKADTMIIEEQSQLSTS